MILSGEIRSMGSLCALEHIELNGVPLESDDFVDKYDHDSYGAEDYCCGDMQADEIPATEEVLTKYNITLSEYNEVASKIAEELSLGSCRWCS